MRKRGFIIVCLLGFLSCGENSGPQIPVSLTPQSALTDANATDLIFIVENTPVDGKTLDLNGDGNPDTFVLPDTCTVALLANCGVPLGSAATVSVGNLPLGYSYSIEARVRNAAGTVIYVATSSFVNAETTPAILLTLTAVAAP